MSRILRTERTGRSCGRRRKKPLSFRVAAVLLLTWLGVVVKQRWHNTAALDRCFRQAGNSGIIIVSNHVTDLDPLLVANLLYHHGIMPHFLAKASLFKIPILGCLLRRVRQIPVERGTKNAALALNVAQEILADGEAVVIYPEGTHTRDPEGWPMRGRPGAVKLALETGAMLVPVAHYGSQKKAGREELRKNWRRTVDIIVGDPIELSQYQSREPTSDILHQATERIMLEIIKLQACLRPGDIPPKRLFNPSEKRPAHGADEKKDDEGKRTIIADGAG